MVGNNIPVLHSLSPEWVQKIYAKKEFECTYCKGTFNFFFQRFWLVYVFLLRMKACTFILSDFPGIRSLSSLNDLNSLNDLSGLNDLNSLISSKNLLSMLLPLTWQQNYQYWSLNVAWIIKKPLLYGVLTLFLLEAMEAMDGTFNQIQGS